MCCIEAHVAVPIIQAAPAPGMQLQRMRITSSVSWDFPPALMPRMRVRPGGGPARAEIRHGPVRKPQERSQAANRLLYWKARDQSESCKGSETKLVGPCDTI